MNKNLKRILKNNVYALGLLLLLIMLENPISSWLFQLGMDALYEVFKYENEWVFIPSFLISFLIIAIIFAADNLSLLLTKNRLIILIPYTFLIYLRISDHYIYYSLPFNDSITYYDLLILIPTSLFILWNLIKPLMLVRNHVSDDNNPLSSTFIQDIPIDSHSKDSFGRRQYAYNISQKIILNKFTEKSIGIAITGDWGSGKTSFLNLVEQSIENKAIVFWFKPWLYQKKISKHFIEELINAISSNNNISRLKLNLKVSKILSGEGHWLIWLKNLFISSTSLKNQIDDLALFIKNNIDKKIIVLLDDLDRLSKKETLEVFSLMRNIGNLPNTYYLVGFSKDQIQSNLKKEVPIKNFDNYLEKFFQEEVQLPYPKNDYIRGLLKFELNFLGKEETKLFEDFFNGSTLDVFKSKRNVIKFVNEYNTLKNLMGNHITFYTDLLYLEYFRHKYKKDFKKIFIKNKSEFFTLNEDGFYLYNNSLLDLLIRNDDNCVKTFGKIFKEHSDIKRISYKTNLELYLNFCYEYIYDFLMPLDLAIKECNQKTLEVELKKILSISGHLSYSKEIDYYFEKLNFNNPKELNTFIEAYNNVDPKVMGINNPIEEAIKRGKKKFHIK